MDKRGLSKIFGGIFIISIIILSLSFVVANISYDDLTNYEDGDKVAVFDNARAEITSHESLNKPIQVNTGWQRVIIINIDSQKNYVDAIGKIEFKNMKTGEKEELRYFWQRAIYGDIEISDYIYNCTKIYFPSNDSFYDKCEKIKIGTHLEKEVIDWKELNTNDVKAENITIGLMVYVKPNDFYDGIPILFGKRIGAWAAWENPVIDITGTPGAQEAQTLEYGPRFTLLQDKINITIISNLPAVTGTTAKIYNITDGSVLIAQASFVGNNATFGNVILVTGKTYQVIIGSDGASYNHQIWTGAAFPITRTNVEYICAGTLTDCRTTWFQNLYSITSLTPGVADTIAPETTIPILNSTDGTNKSNQDLNCYATLTDDQQTNLTADWVWYKNDVLNLSGSTPVTNGTFTLITTLNSVNTIKGEQWKCEVTPYDGFNLGDAKNSSSITVLNSAPNQINPLLKTATGKNLSTEDLICYNKSTSDADNDNVTNIYNWYKDNQSLLALNMPFEINTNDYSGNNNNGNISGATPIDSKDGLGNALSFDGVNDSVSISYSNSLATDNEMTIEAWVKFDSITGGRFVTKSYYRGWLLGYHSNNFYFGGYVLGDTWRYVEYSETPTINTWYHVVGSLKNNVLKIYINGDKKAEYNTIAGFEPEAYQVEIGNSIRWGDPFNGSIDEVKIYPYALTPEQIQAHNNLEYNKIVSQETKAGDNYMCQIIPNDAEADGETLNS